MSRHLILATLILLATTITGHAGQQRILFDQGHAQAFTIEKPGELQLGAFAETLRSTGLAVASADTPLTADLLADIDGLIISGAFAPHSPEEIVAIKQYLQRGGRVAIMLHIARPLWPLLDELGVHVANGVLHEQQNRIDDSGINFTIDDLSGHPLIEGLDRFSLYGGWPLRPAGDHARPIASSSERAWVDLNRDKVLNQGDAMQKFAVIVAGNIGQGEFVVFADDAIFQNRFLDADNQLLAKNLGHWFASK